MSRACHHPPARASHRRLLVSPGRVRRGGMALAMVLCLASPALAHPHPFWQEVARGLATTARGHVAAICAHNCYENRGADPEDSRARTLTRLHAAMAAGADLLELDVKAEGGVLHIDHEDDGGRHGALLGEVLADARLRAASQPLCIESKETAPDEAYVRQLLDMLLASGVVRPGRSLFLRSFPEGMETLVIAGRLLSQEPYTTLRPYIHLHLLLGRRHAREAFIREAYAQGFRGVEIDYRAEGLWDLVVLARGLGLMVGLWTLPVAGGELLIRSWREEVDLLVTDLDPGQARRAVGADDGVLYVELSGYVEPHRTLPLWVGAEPRPWQPGGWQSVDWRPEDPLRGQALAPQGEAQPIPCPDGLIGADGWLLSIVLRLEEGLLDGSEPVQLLSWPGRLELWRVVAEDGAQLQWRLPAADPGGQAVALALGTPGAGPLVLTLVSRGPELWFSTCAEALLQRQPGPPSGAPTAPLTLAPMAAPELRIQRLLLQRLE